MSTWSIRFLFFQAISAAMSSFSIMSLSLLSDKCFRRLIVFMHHMRWIMNILRFLVSSFRSFQHSDSFSNTDFTLLWKPWVCSCYHKYEDVQTGFKIVNTWWVLLILVISIPPDVVIMLPRCEGVYIFQTLFIFLCRVVVH